jgi:hypothetical protein
MSRGIKDATTRTNTDGSVSAVVISAGRPNSCHAACRSATNCSLSLLREPCGRPLGLPDWPGFQGINPRCLCFRTVESLSAASAFDIASNHIQLRQSHHGPPGRRTVDGLFLHRIARPRIGGATNASSGVANVRQAQVCRRQCNGFRLLAKPWARHVANHGLCGEPTKLGPKK